MLDRDLQGVMAEVRAYPGEEELWTVLPGTSNSGGTLARHLAGNLSHFVGALLGGDPYLRDREREFAGAPVALDRVLAELQGARKRVGGILGELESGKLSDPFPPGAPASLGSDPTVREVLLHLSGHLMYHRGQINYHRRTVVGG
jgi:hypothetical protein